MSNYQENGFANAQNGEHVRMEKTKEQRIELLRRDKAEALEDYNNGLSMLVENYYKGQTVSGIPESGYGTGLEAKLVNAEWDEDINLNWEQDIRNKMEQMSGTPEVVKALEDWIPVRNQTIKENIGLLRKLKARISEIDQSIVALER